MTEYPPPPPPPPGFSPEERPTAGAVRSPAPVYAAAPPTNPIAIVAFVASFILSLAGIVCGHIALSRIKRSGEGGRSFAIAALIIGYTSFTIGVLFFLFWLSLLINLSGAPSNT